MRKSDLENRFKRVITDRYIHCTEYQDKYFLMKKIMDIIPSLDESLVYAIIDKCNQQLSLPAKREDFIKLLINQIFPILNEKARLK